jgi:hypothetical protein
MALELYLSRGLVFRVTVPRGRQGHILEMMELKRTVLRPVAVGSFKLSAAAWETEMMLGLTNARVTLCFTWYSQSNIVALLRVYSHRPS